MTGKKRPSTSGSTSSDSGHARKQPVPIEDTELPGPPPESIIVPTGQVLIPGLRRGAGFALVASPDNTRDAPGWRQVGLNLDVIDGLPAGALFYRRIADGAEARVGVRWDEHAQQLFCPVLDRLEPKRNDTLDDDDLWHLELDARTRIGRLISIHAYLGTLISTSSESRRAILAASGIAFEDGQAPADD
ncbi:hypothetical protein [Curtobacterium luteum]|uniref:hypothetical protein n=1 Tax=Curtobacterium luteum TaxID=33881 RepID=UPI00381F528B